MQATIAEVIKTVETELASAGHKNVRHKNMIPCEIGELMWGMILFDNRKIPLETVVTDDKGTFTDRYSDKKAGVMLTFESIPPRKRNPVTTDKRYIIVQ